MKSEGNWRKKIGQSPKIVKEIQEFGKPETMG
jgi:hypothetical protein